ncbi:MAG: LicD family protein [Roseburia sp.]|nr:LicD family protein [Roseburia sp.]
MLEFQKGFFEQEVREGFYIDTTMKTVWAAELEVLQTVAEVCDKYGLAWYAGYGTLLGAVRHQGFVPWDDDMDILMKREDYMKLLAVLPKELPEGFRVRSPFSEEGYSEYHGNVINGSGVSIAPDFLSRFHGCPFTVGLDIFPLDYLPRDRGERELQKSLFTLAGRGTQMAKDILELMKEASGDDEGEEDNQQKIEACKKELTNAIDALEQYCKVTFDRTLILEERWEELLPPLWKLANQLAMMYREEESDYLVMYGDYITWEKKIFPKEWFDETVGLPFENFMIPAVKEYDSFLRMVYGDYSIVVKKSGMHEYPFYKRQLVDLREYVKDVESRSQKLGLLSPVPEEENKEQEDMPASWKAVLEKPDGSRKKVLLYTNNAGELIKYGEKMLKKMEEVFGILQKEQENIALWWRPHKAIPQTVSAAAPELWEKYQQLVEAYQKEGFGIYDTTDKEERAMEASDAYYGDMNALLQSYQETGKPIMILHCRTAEEESGGILDGSKDGDE